jgi:hypothetical protein
MSAPKLRVTISLGRILKFRLPATAVIRGHLKAEHCRDRNYLAHRHGDANNTILAALSS